MPELPEVETVRRGLEPAMVGVVITSVEQRRPNLRFPFPEHFPDRLRGQSVLGLGRRAKYLLADLSSGDVLIMHLGMSGRFLIEAKDGRAMPGAYHHQAGGDRRHDHVVFHLSNRLTITYNDARRFGFMVLVPRADLLQHPLIAKLGVEPLGNELDAELLARLMAGRQAPLKAALMDQGLISGLGNIYVCEALHRAGLSPARAAGSLVTAAGRPTAGAKRLATAIREVLSEAVAAGGSSLRDYAQPNGSLGYFQHGFRVYDREQDPCPTPGCRGTISRMTQAGRSTFFCASCQR
ncbi:MULTISPECIES: bifunctional DNA-formamidopyrimidine glycosylase/DNA-(apurinic or apyrimidinic site) lyase [unclassified Chelatococcus]|uniref:bifunctional DNA-formamidopyrimidine glycosylase/DNA-(apurinic or apyrimidinic site) lyase n=1 Tax=unclassified Chelatococcus TaxID=2638111 RepID=UPI001BCE5D0D|nr:MULTISPECIES: bifunctional DNA-formamidopyrimidine glycosylase/DNA-(apurinic or apyrimidinic site) lyase [unclassified Chelatococcus]MBS7697071.1 bifunctional DNA-formamidopyrimidine glycosylase/DNA-(apurinic or apyrimidinic site) lyase [Chelatococcus sp. YT9]MBX3556061.1 bifunctional DNA-formamidopyrimidine glycosylase/DNA-(apurinic or apyrimidinic site) lyase [Chelatococcus sp.]